MMGMKRRRGEEGCNDDNDRGKERRMMRKKGRRVIKEAIILMEGEDICIMVN